MSGDLLIDVAAVFRSLDSGPGPGVDANIFVPPERHSTAASGTQCTGCKISVTRGAGVHRGSCSEERYRARIKTAWSNLRLTLHHWVNDLLADSLTV